jgi:hypothetical protein
VSCRTVRAASDSAFDLTCRVAFVELVQGACRARPLRRRLLSYGQCRAAAARSAPIAAPCTPSDSAGPRQSSSMCSGAVSSIVSTCAGSISMLATRPHPVRSGSTPLMNCPWRLSRATLRLVLSPSRSTCLRHHLGPVASTQAHKRPPCLDRCVQAPKLKRATKQNMSSTTAAPHHCHTYSRTRLVLLLLLRRRAHRTDCGPDATSASERAPVQSQTSPAHPSMDRRSSRPLPTPPRQTRSRKSAGGSRGS